MAAANAFLSVLTDDERGDVLFDRGDKEQQQRWSNYGWPMVEGTGDTQSGRLTNPLITFPTSEADLGHRPLRQHPLRTIEMYGQPAGKPRNVTEGRKQQTSTKE